MKNQFKNIIGLIILSLIIMLPGRSSAQQKDDGWNVPASAKEKRNPILSDEEYIEIGRNIYEKKCLQCHGENGDGKGPKAIAKSFSGYMGEFNSPMYHLTITDGELFYKINQSKGDKPGFENRQIPDPKDRWALVKYIRTMVDETDMNTTQVPKVWIVSEEARQKRNPILSDEQYIAIGKDIYEKKCMRCHGEKGQGDGPKMLAKKFDGYLGNFSSSAYHNTITDGELFYMINESKGDKPAFSYREIPSVEDRWALVKYLRTMQYIEQ